MKIIVALFIGLICGIGADAQIGTRSRTVSGNQSQVIFPDTARFEIIFLNQLGLTIKLDRYTGKTSVYVADGGRRWFPLEVRNGLPNQFVNKVPAYQIIGDGDSSTFLLNNETGQTWVLSFRTWIPLLD